MLKKDTLAFFFLQISVRSMVHLPCALSLQGPLNYKQQEQEQEQQQEQEQKQQLSTHALHRQWICSLPKDSSNSSIKSFLGKEQAQRNCNHLIGSWPVQSTSSSRICRGKKGGRSRLFSAAGAEPLKYLDVGFWGWSQGPWVLLYRHHHRHQKPLGR
jgi:hypothetical protein